MSKRFTKIICTAVAAISVASLAFLPACKKQWPGVSGAKDTSAYKTSNGGFLTETEDYVYFINGKAKNTDSNDFGSVLKGSVQRLKKTDLNAGNYASTQTVVPSVVYANSNSLNAGLYIYGGCVYYTTPSTDKNSDGEILNGTLEFKRTTLDGSSTSGVFWSTQNLDVDYRYVEVNGTVYILYAVSENQYGTAATNIHSVNCSTGSNTIIAYNVTSYAFDTEDATNPYVYYTMNVPQYLGQSTTYGYNQLYMVRADANSSPREYDLTGAGSTKYINYGTHVFDGIGMLRYKSGDVNQFNYAYNSGKEYTVTNADLTFTIKWYKNRTLYYTRQTNDNNVAFYRLNVEEVDGDDKDGKAGTAAEPWDAMEKIDEQKPLVNSNVTTEYEYVSLKVDGEDGLYAINTTSGGVTRSKVDTEKGTIGEEVYVTDDSAGKILAVREEENLNHTYLYYSVTGGNGYTINRVAIDGTEDDYRKLPTTLVPDLTYETVKVLNLDACSDWYEPEFVDNKLFFASETDGMGNFNYVMVCDLETKEEGKSGIMSNKEIDDLNEKFEGVTEKIEAYDDEKNHDGTAAYEHLSSALKYLYNTGDVGYIDQLINAYVSVEGRDKEYIYSEESVKIYKKFAAAEGDDWQEYREDTKTVNGKTVYANSRDYYYSVVGRMTEGDAASYKQYFKNRYMESYPYVEQLSWWEKLSTGGKVGTVFGILEGCMLVIGGGVILGYYLISRRKTGGSGSSRAIKVDLTDDKDIDVYGDESGENGGENA